MRYCFDIDGTICTTNCHYKDAKPYQQVIDWINKKYDEIMRQADNAVGRKEVVSLLKKAAIIMSKSEENLAA